MTAFFGAQLSSLGSLTAAEITAGGKGFAVGDTYVDNAGNGYTFIQAAGAITGAGFVVRFGVDFQATMLSTANDARGDRVGVALGAIASGEFAWVQTSGVFANVQVLASCAANARLNTTATAGALDDDGTAGSFVIDHIVLTTARAASQGNAPGVAANNIAVGAVL
jgi:hypothetical protein